MKIWLINPYGPLPDEGWRKYRNILLGEMLASKGHEVIWFTSQFSHHFKRYREGDSYETGVNNFHVNYIKTTKYSKNIGLGRLLFELSFCMNSYRTFSKLDTPDVIIAIDPPQFIGVLGRKIAQKNNAILILDLMDEWPELFEKAVSSKFKPVVKLIVPFFKYLRKKNYQQADGIIALGKNYFNLAESLARENVKGRLIYNGMDLEQFNSWAMTTDISSLITNNKKDDDIWCVYAGSLGSQGNNYDLNAVIKAAQFFTKTDKRYKFFVAGAGAGKEKILDIIEKGKLNNLYFLGSLSPQELSAVYNKCDIGLATYGAGSNVDMPDKFYDYSGAGLVTLSSLTGEVRDIIKKEKIGLYYEANNHDDFIQKLKKLGENKEELDVMKKHSKKVGKLFDQKVQSKKILDLIDEIVKC